MAYQKVKHMTGVFTSVFAHTGHITKEQAKEISGLAEKDFEKVYAKGARIAEKVGKAEGKKMDHFLNHFGKEIDEYVKEFGDKFFM
jgi:flagellar biosynthesis/type III secretory pathway protein FliH